jgi:hypothetical protein
MLPYVHLWLRVGQYEIPTLHIRMAASISGASCAGYVEVAYGFGTRRSDLDSLREPR